MIETGVELTFFFFQDTKSDSFPSEKHILNISGSMLASQ